MSKSRSCLFVAYAYPPISSPGAVRAVRTLKTLHDHNWVGYVLTARQGYSLRQGGLADPLADSPSRVVRVKDPIAQVANAAQPLAKVSSQAESNGFIGRLRGVVVGSIKALLFPDRGILWTLVCGLTFRDKAIGDIDLIHSTSPNNSSHIAAWMIARRRKIPWIAEFRDPMSWFPKSAPVSRFRRAILARYEAWIVKRADATVVVSEAFAEYFRDLYPDRKIVSIPNGAEFDLAEVEKNALVRRDRKKDAPIHLVHTGSFYGGDRRPAPLIEAAKRARDQYGASVSVSFAGEDADLAKQAADNLKCPELVNILGNMEHAAAMNLIASADANVALLNDDEVARIGIMSKFFDYLPAGAPILTLGSPAAMLSRIVVEEDLGAAFSYQDIDKIAQWIAAVPSAKKPNTIEACNRWSALNMSASMATLFDETLEAAK